ncbi:MAG: helix-turn-helix transcriptional regulator [Pseudomonadota bacterium]
MTEKPESMADRIRLCADIVGSGNELARRTGIARASLENYFKGREPQASKLAAIANAAGVSLDWLIAGKTAETNVEGPPPVQSTTIDVELLGRLTDAISRLYKDLGVSLAPVDLGRLAGERYSDIAAATTDPDEQRAMIKLVVQQLRKDIQAAAAKPGTGKHVA